MAISELNITDVKAGERLRQVRKDVLNISSGHTLAAELGLPYSSYVCYELGKMEIGVRFLARINELYKVNPQYIIFGTGSPLEGLKGNSSMASDIQKLKSEVLALKAIVTKLSKSIQK